MASKTDGLLLSKSFLCWYGTAMSSVSKLLGIYYCAGLLVPGNDKINEDKKSFLPVSSSGKDTSSGS